MFKSSEKPGLTWEVVCETSLGSYYPLCSCLTEDSDVGFRPLPQRRQTAAQMGGCSEGVLVGEPAVLAQNYLQGCWKEGRPRFYSFILSNIQGFIKGTEQGKRWMVRNWKMEWCKSIISLKKPLNCCKALLLCPIPQSHAWPVPY